MKEFVIRVNNIALYSALVGIWVGSFFALFLIGFKPALGMFVGGTIGWCIVSGFWFVQSGTYEELRKLNANSGLTNQSETESAAISTGPQNWK